MENKKQTAVEWLIDMISYTSKDTYSAMVSSNFFEQAKEMEKYQILDSFVEGNRFKVDTAQSTPDGIEPEVMGAVDYYDNVYNK